LCFIEKAEEKGTTWVVRPSNPPQENTLKNGAKRKRGKERSAPFLMWFSYEEEEGQV